MALGVFARAATAGLAKLGEPSSLNGTPCGNVAIQRGVEVFAASLGTADDNHVAKVDTATIETQFTPATGGIVVHPDGTYRLERLLRNNGYTKTFIIVSTT